LARIKLAGRWRPPAEPVQDGQWVVAQACQAYIEYCQRGVARGTISQGHRESVVRHLTDLCEYCGAVPVSELKKEHVRHWIESHPTWRSPATHRNVIASVLAAFNHAQEVHDVPNPLRGLKKPPPRPRLHSFTVEEEQVL
jgi:hypothetical protein